ncbi:hypothetical protein Tco_0597624 [Tanacetum coccineum]
MSPTDEGLEVGSIRRIQGIGYGVLEFLGFPYFCIAIEPYANINKSETVEDFERSVYGDLSSSSFFKKLDQLKGVDERSAMNSRFSGSRRGGLMDGLDDSFKSLTHGLHGILKDAVTYFEYDVNEVEKEDYKFRPDVTFWPGPLYGDGTGPPESVGRPCSRMSDVVSKI